MSLLVCMQGKQSAFSSGSHSDSADASGSDGREGQGRSNTKGKRRAKVLSIESTLGFYCSGHWPQSWPTATTCCRRTGRRKSLRPASQPGLAAEGRVHQARTAQGWWQVRSRWQATRMRSSLLPAPSHQEGAGAARQPLRISQMHSQAEVISRMRPHQVAAALRHLCQVQL